MKSMPLLSNLPNRRADTGQLAVLLCSLPWQTHSFWPRPRLCKLHRLLLRLQADIRLKALDPVFPADFAEQDGQALSKPEQARAMQMAVQARMTAELAAMRQLPEPAEAPKSSQDDRLTA